MKKANIILQLWKGHEVSLAGVTPIEALLLTAEHNKNVGEIPVKVDKATITDATVEEETVGKDGKPVKAKRPVTVDEEFDRLTSKYGKSKVQSVRSQVSDLGKLADDFDAAIQRGIKVTMAKGAFGGA